MSRLRQLILVRAKKKTFFWYLTSRASTVLSSMGTLADRFLDFQRLTVFLTFLDFLDFLAQGGWAVAELPQFPQHAAGSAQGKLFFLHSVGPLPIGTCVGATLASQVTWGWLIETQDASEGADGTLGPPFCALSLGPVCTIPLARPCAQWQLCLTVTAPNRFNHPLQSPS